MYRILLRQFHVFYQRVFARPVFNIGNQVSAFPSQILWKPLTQSFKRYTIRPKNAPKPKCPKKLKTLRSTLQTYNLVSLFLSVIWDTTWKQYWQWIWSIILDSKSSSKHKVTGKLHRSSISVFLKFTMTWATPVVRKNLLYLLVSIDSLWCLEKNRCSTLTKKTPEVSCCKTKKRSSFMDGFQFYVGSDFGALAQVIRWTTFPFSNKFVVLAAKRLGPDLLVLLRQKTKNLLVVEDKTWKELQRVGES